MQSSLYYALEFLIFLKKFINREEREKERKSGLYWKNVGRILSATKRILIVPHFFATLYIIPLFYQFCFTNERF